MTETSGNPLNAPAGARDPDSTQPRLATLRFEHAAATHVGLVREANEDNFVALPELGVFVVADGMGGHVGGKLASEICASTVQEYFAGSERGELIDMESFSGLSRESLELAEALLLSNQRIFDRSNAERDLAGMGTTVVGIRLVGDRVGVSHAGDSRCYLFRDDELAQVTVDHSLSNFLFALGRDIEARYAAQTMSNVIMRALGLESEVAIDTKEFALRAHDRLLLCSDGLSDLVPDEVIAEVLSDDAPLDDVVAELVELALGAGGRDNITVMVVDVHGLPHELSDTFSQTADAPVAEVTSDSTAEVALGETLLPPED